MTFCQSIASVILPICQSVDSIGFDSLSRYRLGAVAASDAVLMRLRARNTKPHELQKALGVSPSMASRILDGSRGISVWHLDAIADLLGTTVSELFNEAPSNEIVIGRNGPSYSANKPLEVYQIAQSDTVPVRQNTPPVQLAEDVADAYTALDRPSQSAVDTDKKAISEVFDRLRLAEQLYGVLAAADIQLDTIRDVADALRAGGRTPAPRKKPATKNGSRRPVGQRSQRRRRA